MNVHRKFKGGVLISEEITGGSQPVKRDWPTVLLPIKLLAKPSDRGAGDIIARVIGPIGGDAFKKWYKATFGRDCGCGNRQEALNRRWPL